MTKHLFTPNDVKKVRLDLLAQQKGLCALTGEPIFDYKGVLDHNHKTDFVRGVLHRNANSALGRIENLYTRELSWWYPESLSTFLRQCADYLDKQDNVEYIHPGWLKKVQTMFNKLPEGKKDLVLIQLGEEAKKNATERKKAFRKRLMSRVFTKQDIVEAIEGVKCE